jgi:hypothetical protein
LVATLPISDRNIPTYLLHTEQVEAWERKTGNEKERKEKQKRHFVKGTH